MTICRGCAADRDLTPHNLCPTCERERAAGRLTFDRHPLTDTGIPGAARSLFGRPPGSLFNIVEEKQSERRALKRSRREASQPITETVSPADDLTPEPQTPDKTGQKRLF